MTLRIPIYPKEYPWNRQLAVNLKGFETYAGRERSIVMPFRERQLEHTPGSLLTLDEAAQRMNVQPEDVRQMISNNQLPGHEVAGELMVDVAQIDLFTSNEIKIAMALDRE